MDAQVLDGVSEVAAPAESHGQPAASSQGDHHSGHHSHVRMFALLRASLLQMSSCTSLQGSAVPVVVGRGESAVSPLAKAYSARLPNHPSWRVA